MQRGALMFRRFKNLFVFALVAAIGTAGLSGCGENSETVSDIDLTKIQRLSYDATNEHEIALEKFNKGCEPAKIIRDDKSQTNKNFCLIFQGAKDSVTVEKILQILDEKNIKATFAITAATAAEDDALIDLIIQKGHDIIDNGLNGDSSIDVLSDEDMVSNFSDSRKVFSTLMDVPPDKMMLNTTYYNDTICMAASASGYSKLVSPSSGSYLNEKSFRDDQNTFEYVSKQGNGRILVIKLDEYVESLEVDPKIEYKDPAIDVQPTIVSSSEEDEDKRDVVTMVGWLLDAMQTQGIDNVKLDKLKALNDEEYVRQLYEETGGYSAEVYEEVATMQDVTGLCFYGIPENVESVDAITKALIKAGAKATFFVTGFAIAAACISWNPFCLNPEACSRHKKCQCGNDQDDQEERRADQLRLRHRKEDKHHGYCCTQFDGCCRRKLLPHAVSYISRYGSRCFLFRSVKRRADRSGKSRSSHE